MWSAFLWIETYAMNYCPHCRATASPLRLVGNSPYICPKCGGHSTNTEPRAESLEAVAFVLGAVSAGLITGACGLLDGKVTVIGFSVGIACLICFRVGWLIILRWFFGHLSPLPEYLAI
jgi:hypothetical protein